MTTETQMGYRNYSTTSETATGWAIARAVAKWMTDNGFDALAHKGPGSCSPDDETTSHCCSVRASNDAWMAFDNRRSR